MSRRYCEQVQVQLGEPLLGLPVVSRPTAEVPTAFIWRGRVHLVREVLDHWTQRLPWWQDTGIVAEGADSADEPVAGQSTAGRSAGQQPVMEQQVWRVEAGAGRVMGTGVYDLTLERGTGAHAGEQQWHLVRVSD